MKTNYNVEKIAQLTDEEFDKEYNVILERANKIEEELNQSYDMEEDDVLSHGDSIRLAGLSQELDALDKILDELNAIAEEREETVEPYNTGAFS